MKSLLSCLMPTWNTGWRKRWRGRMSLSPTKMSKPGKCGDGWCEFWKLQGLDGLDGLDGLGDKAWSLRSSWDFLPQAEWWSITFADIKKWGVILLRTVANLKHDVNRMAQISMGSSRRDSVVAGYPHSFCGWVSFHTLYRQYTDY
jgi:hypothetical protein